MAFSEEVVERAWARSGGRCECTRSNHWHNERCKGIIIKAFRGERDNSYGWEAHSKNGNLSNLSDCEILCTRCYQLVFKESAPRLL